MFKPCSVHVYQSKSLIKYIYLGIRFVLFIIHLLRDSIRTCVVCGVCVSLSPCSFVVPPQATTHSIQCLNVEYKHAMLLHVSEHKFELRKIIAKLELPLRIANTEFETAKTNTFNN